MTHHTDAERAEFEAVASDNGQWPQAIERDAKGDYLLMTTAMGWMWWQAARRAPAAPVPQWWKLVPDANNMTDEQAEAICNLVSCCGGGAHEIYEAALAAAPQPPQAVPPFTPLAQRKLDDLLSQGFQVTGYSIERADVADWAPQRGFVTHGGMVGWWRPHAAADGLISPAAFGPSACIERLELNN